AFALCRIARKENRDGVQGRTSKPANPLVGAIPTGITEHLRTCGHALPKFFGKSCERWFVRSKRAKPLPRKGNRYPSLLAFDRLSRLWNRGDFVQNSRQPCSPPHGRMK